MNPDAITHTGTLWRWTSDKGPAAWHFVSIDGSAGETLSAHALMRKLELGRSRGFGSIKVSARIGASEWRTSCFPDKQRGWLLPIKKAVRVANNLIEGDEVRLELVPD